MSHPFGIPYGYEASTQAFPSYIGNRHLTTVGPTRSGKGATIIIPALLRMPHSTVVIDPKGQNAAVTAAARRAMGQDVFVLNPFGLHTQPPWNLPRHRYNPLARLRMDEPNVAAQTAALAQALIVTQGRDPYFDDTARDLVATVTMHLMATLGHRASLAHVRRTIAQIAARHTEAEVLFKEMENSPFSFIRQPIARFRDPEARDIASAINTALTQTAFLEDPALTSQHQNGALTGSDFEFTWLKRRPTTVYIILPGMLMEAYARFLRLIITSAIDAVTSETGGYPVVMLLDEAARLEALPALTSAMGFAAGFNFQIHSFWQDIPQLQTLGPKWMSVLANCGLIQFLTPADIDTAEHIQRRGGTYTAQTRSQSYTGRIIKRRAGESRGETRLPLLPIERVMSLPEHQSVVFFAGDHSPLLVGRKPYWEVRRLRGLFAVDPYHTTP